MNASSYRQFASVILDLSVQKKLDYGIPDSLIGRLSRGNLVKVPLKGQFRYGMIHEIKEQTEYPNIKPVENYLVEDFRFSEELFQLGIWMANYYCTPLEEILKLMIPASIRGKGRPKEESYVIPSKSVPELISACKEFRQKNSAAADLLDILIHTKKGIFLSDLLELSLASRGAVSSLAKKGLIKLEKRAVDRSPLIDEEYFLSGPKALTTEQTEALEKIEISLSKNCFDTHLLFGITGSGKTEVYLQAIQKALELGKGTIMLVPEISLTIQTIERFKSRFKEKIAILHYRLSHGERYDEWMKIANGTSKIVVGARSALFSPVKNLGLIIIDEEHDASFKQSESMPCYHARDVAIMRAKLTKIPIVLGSATPSLESYDNSINGKYLLSTLKNRPQNAFLPALKLVDMRKEYNKSQGFTIFSEELLNALDKRIKLGEKSILFLNRRGYHTTLFCQTCGQSVICQHCDIALTFHLNANRLSCHLCGYECFPPPQLCLNCKSPNPMKYKGYGTELVEKALHAIFKDIRTIRVDRDTTKLKGSHQKLLSEFKSGKADILIGTQMVAKGLHFPDVTLVGILNCDATLHIPDFRSSETTFQLITQVAGRAGRGEVPGEVILQSFLLENSTIKRASEQNYEGFFEEEIAVRKAFGYPPFSKLAKIRFSGQNQEKTYLEAALFREKLIQLLPKDVEITPLLPSGYAKIKNLYRFQFLLRGPKILLITDAINQLLQKRKRTSKIKCFIDINPISTFF